MRYAVLGGAGAMGRIVVRDLLAYAARGDEILVADYDGGKAERAVAELKKVKSPARLSAALIDVRQRAAAANVLSGSFAVLNCVQYQLNLEVMEVALEIGAHYLDLGGLFHMTRRQLELHGRFVRARRLALLGIGAAPGITNLLAVHAAKDLDEVREIHTRVAGVDQTRYAFAPALPVSYSLQTILEEFSAPPAVFTRGKLTFVEPMSGQTPNRFPPPVGVQHPMYTLHSEVATLPGSFKDKGVREVSFKIAFEPSFLEKVRFLRDLGLASATPLRVGEAAVKPIELVNKVAMSQKPAVPKGPLRQHEIVRAVVKGVRGRRKVTVVADCHTAGLPAWGFGTDVNTGCPIAIAARMLAEGVVQNVGCLPPETAVLPEAFFAQLARRKMRVSLRTHPGLDFGC